MRAVYYERLGPANRVLEVGEMADPTPGTGEVRVRVVSSGVNPIDVKRRQGGRGEMADAQVIPHFDGAGVIDAVGDGVPAEREGQRVWMYEAQWQRPFGTAAEFVTLPADLAVLLPEQTSFDQGAALGIPALTAHRAVFADGSVDGLHVLVTGGAGAVGRYAVQFAALAGATVLATVSGTAKAESAKTAGATHVINYQEQDVAAEIDTLTSGAGVDRVVEVEFGGNLESVLPALRPGATIATYASQAAPEPTLPFYQLLYKSITVRHVLAFQIPVDAKRSAIADIDRWMREEALTHHVGERFPMSRVIEAHEAVEAGAFGKVVLDVDA